MNLTACANEELELTEDNHNVIVLNVESLENSTKALVENTESLKDLCTKPNSGIGIFGFKEGSTELLFENTRLYFRNQWIYDQPRSWEKDRFYHFFAYYPYFKTTNPLLSYDILNNQLNYSYNTLKNQYDLLIAHTQVNVTNEQVTKEPVQLKLKHALASIRFLIKLAAKTMESDRLTTCWLETNTNNVFSTAALLSCNQDVTIWHSTIFAKANMPLYRWENTEGILLSKEEPITAYTLGNYFSSNNGWLLLIPQKISNNTLSFCFNTLKERHKVNLEFINGLEAGKRYTFTITLNQLANTGHETSVDIDIDTWNIVNDNHSFF